MGLTPPLASPPPPGLQGGCGDVYGAIFGGGGPCGSDNPPPAIWGDICGSVLGIPMGLTPPFLPPQEYVGRKRLRARLRALEPLRQVCPPRPQGPPPGPLDSTWLQEAFGTGGAGGALPKGSRFTRTQHLTHEQVGWGDCRGAEGCFGGAGAAAGGLGDCFWRVGGGC